MTTTGSSSTDPDRSAPSTATTVRAGDTDLDTALEGLARVAVGSQTLEQSLEWIANLAAVAIPGAEGAGVTMLEDNHTDTICASAPFVRDVDAIQYGLREGPCITAADEGRTVRSGALGSDPSWPRFGPRVRALGVNSVVSVPLLMPDGEVMGALNVYAHPHDVFTDDAARRGEAFAVAAAVAVNNARTLMQAQRVADQLRTALVSRATIDQAIGILMSRQGGSPEDAFAALKRLSQNQNVKLAVVAQEVVREAVTRARARHGGAVVDG